MLQNATEKQFENFNRLLICAEWCKHHNAKLIRMETNGFYYANANGEWYISYEEM